jgi:hypothetical protein
MYQMGEVWAGSWIDTGAYGAGVVLKNFASYVVQRGDFNRAHIVEGIGAIGNICEQFETTECWNFLKESGYVAH